MQINLTPEQDALATYCAGVDGYTDVQKWLNDRFPSMLGGEAGRCKADELSTIQARVSVLPDVSKEIIRQAIAAEEAKVPK